MAFDQGRTKTAGALIAAAGRVRRSLGTSLDAFGPQLLGWAERRMPGQRGTSVRPRRDLDDVIDLA
jgi:hypothetical protein